MRTTLFTAAAASFAALLIVAGQAQAQAPRTFVSGHGEDTNPCSLAAPCRSFAQAITQTNAGGEIVVLDSAGYGTVTIGKSITITNPGGVEAGITTAEGQTAIVIDASSSIAVTLRGLTLEGGGVGQNGIILGSSTAGTLNIIDCVVKDFAGNGIAIIPSFANPGTAGVLIANSYVLNSGNSGIEVDPLSLNTTVRFLIDHTTVAGNGTSGNDAGMLFNAGSGFLLGDINSSRVYRNLAGANFIGESTVARIFIEQSVIVSNLNADISTNSPPLFLVLYNSNRIDFIFNNQTIGTDGTNDIQGVEGPALNPLARQ